MPLFGHLPFVMGEGNKKLSKRDPESSLMLYRERGFLPEALLNYLAFVGWSMGEDRELFSLQEMVDAFSLERVSRNPARFDLKKCEAINGVKIRELAPDEAAIRILPFLQKVGMITEPPTADQLRLLAGGAPLVQERITVLSEAVGMLGFLFVADDVFEPDAEAAAKNLNAAAVPALAAAVASLEPVEHWHGDDIKEALETALIGELGLKPRNAYAPLRVAVTGRTVSPPLFESMELLGRERTHGATSASGCVGAARGPVEALPSALGGPSGVRYTRPAIGEGLSDQMGYGVIGSPADSGSASLGSSPGTPATRPKVSARPRCLAA